MLDESERPEASRTARALAAFIDVGTPLAALAHAHFIARYLHGVLAAESLDVDVAVFRTLGPSLLGLAAVVAVVGLVGRIGPAANAGSLGRALTGLAYERTSAPIVPNGRLVLRSAPAIASLTLGGVQVWLADGFDELFEVAGRLQTTTLWLSMALAAMVVADALSVLVRPSARTIGDRVEGTRIVAVRRDDLESLTKAGRLVRGLVAVSLVVTAATTALSLEDVDPLDVESALALAESAFRPTASYAMYVATFGTIGFLSLLTLAFDARTRRAPQSFGRIAATMALPIVQALALREAVRRWTTDANLTDADVRGVTTLVDVFAVAWTLRWTLPIPALWSAFRPQDVSPEHVAMLADGILVSQSIASITLFLVVPRLVRMLAAAGPVRTDSSRNL